MRKQLPILILFYSVASLASPPPKCPAADIAVRVTFSTVYDSTGEPTRINNDVAAAFEDGKDGVSAKIQRCNGTNDLVVDTLSSSPVRRAIFNLVERLYLNANSPSFTNAAAAFHFKFNDLFHGYSEFVPYTYTTYGGFAFDGPDGAHYALRFVNPLADTGNNTGMQPADFNSPYMTSKLVLTHTPSSLSPATPEQWILAPDTAISTPANGGPAAAQVGTLLKEPKGKPGFVTAGQFRMPFKLVITRK